MKTNYTNSIYKPMRLVLAFSYLMGLAVQPSFAQHANKANNQINASLRGTASPAQAGKQSQKPAIETVLLGYYPANYLMASPSASLRVQNQFIGMGDKLCVWIQGEYTSDPSLRGTKQSPADNASASLNDHVSTGSTTEITDPSLRGTKQSLTNKTKAIGFTAVLTNDSTFTTTITQIETQYYPAQKATALFIPMPTNAILYNAYNLKLSYNQKNIGIINKLYLVPSFIMPILQTTATQININNTNELTGGQAPFQYYWMEYTNGHGKMVSSGSIDELSKLPTITTQDKDATYSLMIKDANYLVSNQFISTKASNLPSTNPSLPSVGILTNRNINVKIYPNPTTTELYVQFDPSLRGSASPAQAGKQSQNGQLSTDNYQLTYTITDLLGKELLKGSLNTADLKTIAVQALTQGTYMLSITNTKDSSILYQNKFVKL